LWLMTSVGFRTVSITFAMVKVFPVPVAPSSVCQRRGARTPSTSVRIASG